MPAKRVARQPREWATDPTKFGEMPGGRSAPVRWHRPADDFERICRDAAQIQHEIIAVANGYRRERGGISWKDLAGEFQMSYVQLMKVVRGQAHISMRHVADITHVLGPVFITEYRRLVQQVNDET